MTFYVQSLLDTLERRNYVKKHLLSLFIIGLTFHNDLLHYLI